MINKLPRPQYTYQRDYNDGHASATVEINNIGKPPTYVYSFDTFTELVDYFNVKVCKSTVYTPARILSYWQGYRAALISHARSLKSCN